MPTLEDVLEKETYKGQGVDTARRVFYTLHGNPLDSAKLQAERNSIAIAALIQILHDEKRFISTEQLDKILLDVVT